MSDTSCAVAPSCGGKGTPQLWQPVKDGGRARTIADPAGQERLGPEQVAEVIQYRSLERAARRLDPDRLLAAEKGKV